MYQLTETGLFGATRYNTNGDEVKLDSGMYFPDDLSIKFKLNGVTKAGLSSNEKTYSIFTAYPDSTTPTVLYAFRQGSNQNQAFVLKVETDSSTTLDTNNGNINLKKSGVTQLSLDGTTVGASKPVKMPSYTLATLPVATVGAGSMIYVSDATGGGVMCYSDGSNWKKVTDGATVS
jgi:hypothetical protein